jgi:hypothetical protein
MNLTLTNGLMTNQELIMHKEELIYDTKSLEDMIFFIDRMKIKKRFKS